MTPNIEIQSNNNCVLTIIDTTDYQQESDTSKLNKTYKYSESCSVDVLRYNKIDKAIYKYKIYNPHTGEYSTSLPIKSDGYFTIIHLIFPTLQYIKDNNITFERNNGPVIYTDGQSYYNYISESQIEEISIEDVIEKADEDNSTVLKAEKDFVSICLLRKCYINLCQQIFNNRGFSHCLDRSTVDNDLIYRRDLLWMAINVIEYLTECNQLNEVERIIEMLDGCNGLCLPSDITSKTNGCGCS